ncbi:MAG TPA: hypothetical protein VFV99_03140 [Kofleriaceae bacterium]|nr:hypothetical protein [Kofleriaceae bacterium]
MSNVERTTEAPSEIETLETLETVTGGCSFGGCYGGGCGGRIAYRSSGFGFDPMFMLLAMTLMSNSSTK